MREVDKLLPSKGLVSFYDQNKKLRKSWTPTGTGASTKTPSKKTMNLREYIEWLRTDGVPGARHNGNYMQGTRHWYKDRNGNKVYVKVSDPNKYQLGEAVLVQDPDNPLIQWTDIELLGAAQQNPEGNPEGNPEVSPEQVDRNPDGTIKGTTITPDNSKSDTYAEVLKIPPEAISFDRFLRTLNTNKKIFNLYDSSMQPALLDAPNFFHPVTGDYLGMVVTTKDNADMMRRLDSQATRDASLNRAAMLQGWNQALDNSAKAQLRDDQERRRTSELAYNDRKQTAIGWNETANKNRLSINETNKKKAQLLADYYLQRNNAFQAYLGEFQQKAQQKLNDYKSYLAMEKAIEIQNKYKDRLDSLMQEAKQWSIDNNKSILHAPAYVEYKRLEAAMQLDIQAFSNRQNAIFNHFPLYEQPKYYSPTEAPDNETES